jgi:hypothetical protein
MPVRSPLWTVRSKLWPAKAFWWRLPSGHNLDAGQVALVDRPVEALAGKGLLVEAAVGVAVEEAAELVLQLLDSFDGAFHQPPGQVLTRQPFAADDGVHEVPLQGVARGERDVVAALDHTGAAALAEQSLDGDGDLELRVGLQRVQRREQPGAARADDQEVRRVALEVHVATRPPRPRSSASGGQATAGTRSPEPSARKLDARSGARPGPTRRP